MRLARAYVSVILLPLLISAFAPTASTQPPPQRNASAITLLNQSVSALGGAGWYSPTSGVIARGTIAATPGGISGSILWENAGMEFRYERPGPNGSTVFVSGHGNPAILDGGKVRQGAIGHLVMNLVPPHLAAIVLAKNLAKANTQISSVQQVAIGGVAALKVSSVDLTDELSAQICKQDWYFDPVSLLPVRVDFLTSEASNALNTATMTYLFSNYQNVAGVSFPFQVTTLFNGQQIETITFNSIQTGAIIATTDFDAPSSTTGGGL